MRAELGLSKTEARCVSAWTGYRATAVETVYTSPTWDYDTVVITVPVEMRGAAFSSAELRYSVSSVGGTKSIRFEDTREMYSDTALLKRLQNGETCISLLFSYKASGGSGGEGTHESTCYWRNLALFAEYTPSGAVQGMVQVSGRSVFYSFDRASAAPGEETGISLSVTPAPGRACSCRA